MNAGVHSFNKYLFADLLPDRLCTRCLGIPVDKTDYISALGKPAF